MSDELQAYLAQVASQLSVDPTTEREILWEIQAHLEEAAAELQEDGSSSEESLALAIERFGPARDVGRVLGLLHSESANQAVLAAFLPVALALTFRWVLLPLLTSLAHWQGSPTPLLIACLAIVALAVPGLTFRNWRYGYAVWAFFSLVSIAQL